MTTALIISGAAPTHKSLLEAASPEEDRPESLGFSELFSSLVRAVAPTLDSAGGAAGVKGELAPGDNDQVSQESNGISLDMAPRFASMAPFDLGVVARQALPQFAGEAAVIVTRPVSAAILVAGKPVSVGNLANRPVADLASIAPPRANAAMVLDSDGQQDGLSMAHQASQSEHGADAMLKVNAPTALAGPSLEQDTLIPINVVKSAKPVTESEMATPIELRASLSERGLNLSGNPSIDAVTQAFDSTGEDKTFGQLNPMARAQAALGTGHGDSTTGQSPYKPGEIIAGEHGQTSRAALMATGETPASATGGPQGEKGLQQVNAMVPAQAALGTGHGDSTTGQSPYKPGEIIDGGEHGQTSRAAPMPTQESPASATGGPRGEKALQQVNSMVAAQGSLGDGHQETGTNQSQHKPTEKIGAIEHGQPARLAPLTAVAAAAHWAQANGMSDDAGEPAWQPVLQRVTEQIAQQVRIGQQQAVIELEPAGLGKIRIDVHVEGEQIYGRIVAEEQGTKALIESRLAELRQALETRRLDFASLQVEQQNVAGGGGHSGQTFNHGFRQDQGPWYGNSSRPEGLANEPAQTEELPRPEKAAGGISMWA